MWYSNSAGKDGCADAHGRLTESQCETNGTNDDMEKQLKTLVSTDIPATQDEVLELQHAQKSAEESLDDFIHRTCVWCSRGAGSVARSKDEFLVRSPGIWLHALQYQMTTIDGEEICFRTETPVWGIARKCA